VGVTVGSSVGVKEGSGVGVSRGSGVKDGVIVGIGLILGVKLGIGLRVSRGLGMVEGMISIGGVGPGSDRGRLRIELMIPHEPKATKRIIPPPKKVTTRGLSQKEFPGCGITGSGWFPEGLLGDIGARRLPTAIVATWETLGVGVGVGVGVEDGDGGA
jgi:hypothetical protein